VGEPCTIYEGTRPIHTSRNLRGLLDHARRVGAPHHVELRQRAPMSWNQPFKMVCRFPDGSHGVAFWADWRVAGDWMRARRSWGKPGAEGGPQVAGLDGFVNRALGLAGALTPRDFRSWAERPGDESGTAQGSARPRPPRATA
jgi:hypothetical protein